MPKTDTLSINPFHFHTNKGATIRKIKKLLDKGHIISVYLISHNRRIVEILDPSLIDIKQMYEIDFVGMTTNPITLADLIDVKSDLIRTVHGLLDERDKKFLVDFKAGYPNWSYFSVPHIKDLPAVRWKLYNLDQVDIPKRQQMVDRLKAFLAPL